MKSEVWRINTLLASNSFHARLISLSQNHSRHLIGISDTQIYLRMALIFMDFSKVGLNHIHCRHPYLCMPPHIFSHRSHCKSQNWLKCSETVQVPWTFCRMIRDLLVNSQHCKLLMYSKRRFRDMVQKCNDWLDRITRSNQVSIRCLVCFIIHMKIGRDFALQSKLKM